MVKTLNIPFLQNMLSNLIRGTIDLSTFGRKHISDLSPEPQQAVKAVLSATGEVSSLIYAENLLNIIESMDDKNLAALLAHLLGNYDINAQHLIEVATTYENSPTDNGIELIANAAEPKWMELFRRLNATKSGTVRLVHFRHRLRELIQHHPNFRRIDLGLIRLFRNWFNPGFLVLEPIDWSTPANILEKIIAYEAVHEITSWQDLRARLAPDDRRCFAFFHPAMPNEPLIFVEVALTTDIPRHIENVLSLNRNTDAATKATTAVFYSISNCQVGLAGISFGNFLLKQVASDLRQELPNLVRFVTLSPVPGLMQWMNKAYPDLASEFTGINQDFWSKKAEKLRKDFIKAALEYLTISNRPDGLPNDPVARFHLGNGAFLEQLNFGGDRSKKALIQAGGLMVNYLYDLKVVEKNHEEFNRTKAVPVSSGIKALLKSL